MRKSTFLVLHINHHNPFKEKCHNLLSLDFTCCTSIQPGFFIKFFYNFPLLTKINLTGSLVDDETFNSIGSLCSGLREMIATDSTISDKGLLHLCRGEEGLRCRNLVSVSLAKTKCSAWGVASMLHFHPRLVYLGWPDISLVFQSFQDPDMVETTGQVQFVVSFFTPAMNLSEKSK